MPNKIVVEIEALDYTVNERDVAEALKSHFPNMPTRVREIRPTPVAGDGASCSCPSGMFSSVDGNCAWCGLPVIPRA